MTKEILVNNILNIPHSKLGRIVDKDECLEGNDRQVHYIASRHIIKESGRKIDFFSVSVSGAELEKAKFIKDLTKKLGEPLSQNTIDSFPGVIFVFWDAKKVTKKLQN